MVKSDVELPFQIRRRNSNGLKRANFIILFLVALYCTLRIAFPRLVHSCGRALYVPTPKGSIKWESCGKGFECGILEVPLDYHNKSLGNSTLSVGRYLATSKTRLGSVFINPGGPGGSGVGFLHRTGAQLSDFFDGQYDIVSWDPRGINKTTPRIECFPDKHTQDIFILEHSASIEVGNISASEGAAQLRYQLETAYSTSELVSTLCEKYSGETLRHVGTATVARDLEYLSSVIEGKDTPVNYAGFSYGTAVGNYFVNMFPSRVGRVLIDGVIDPNLWANKPAYLRGARDHQDSEKAFDNFVLSCVAAGPERCALATNSTTALHLNAKIRSAIVDLVVHPLPVPHAKFPGVLRSSHIKGFYTCSLGRVFMTFNFPSSPYLRWYVRARSWPKLAEDLAAFFAGDGEAILEAVRDNLNISDTKSPQRTRFAFDAVHCVDSPPLYGTFTPEEAVDELLGAAITTYKESSSMFASLSVDASCFTWKAEESERYSGPFNNSLANPILVIGNTADPICPLNNAKEVNKQLADSRLVIQDGPGHCSLAQVSLCTGKILREYFLEGRLPENGKLCPVTEILFPPNPPVDNATSDSSWEFVAPGSLTADDLLLMKKLRAFGEAAQTDMSGFKGFI